MEKQINPPSQQVNKKSVRIYRKYDQHNKLHLTYLDYCIQELQNIYSAHRLFTKIDHMLDYKGTTNFKELKSEYALFPNGIKQ